MPNPFRKHTETFTFHEFAAEHEDGMVGIRLKAAVMVGEMAREDIAVILHGSPVDSLSLLLAAFALQCKDHPKLRAASINALKATMAAVEAMIASEEAA